MVDPKNTLGLGSSASNPVLAMTTGLYTGTVPNDAWNQPLGDPITPAFVTWQVDPTVLANCIDMTGKDIITIPLVLAVPKTHYTQNYTINYHKLSDDNTLVDWAVPGRIPDTYNTTAEKKE